MISSQMVAVDAAAEHLLGVVGAALTAPAERLVAAVGPAPPFRLAVASEPGAGFGWFDALGRLNLDPAFLKNGAIAARHPRDERGDGGLSGALRLVLTLLEGAARWAMTLRANLLPEELERLELARSWSWEGMGLWLASRALGDAALEDPLARQPVPHLAAGGREAAALWRALEARRGLAQALEAAEALAVAAAKGGEALPQAAIQALPQALADAPEFLLHLGELALGGAPSPLAPRRMEVSAEDLQLGGVAEAGSLVALTVTGVPGAPCAVEVEGGQVFVRRDGRWQPLRGEVEHSAELLMVFLEGGAWRVHRAPNPLLGWWIIRGADFAGQVFGVRGLSVRFDADGSLEVQLGDAIVGPINASGLSMAHRLGVSGIGRGRWALEEGRLQLSELETGELTVHARGSGSPFAFPSPQADQSAAFFARSLESVPWRIITGEEELSLTSSFGGAPASLRLSRELPEVDPALPDA